MLKEEEIDSVVDRIKQQINPRQIYLFGSYASGKATEASDLDLLIVDDSGKNKNDLALKISKSLFPRNFGLELIVISPEELQAKQSKGLSFWRGILQSSRKLYERN